MLEHDLTAEQLELQASVRAFTERAVRPGYLARAKDDAYPEEIVRALAEENLLGLRYSTGIGGRGLDETSVGIVLEELAKGDMNVALLTFFMGGSRTDAGLPPELAEQVAKQVIAGQMMTAAGITEPQGGSDVASIQTTAVLDGDEYIINGEKISVGMAAWSRYASVLCRVGDADGYRGLASVFVDLDQPGVTRGRIRDMGSGVVGRGWLRFDGARTPANWLLQPQGQGFVQTMKAFDVARVLVSLMALGCAEASLQDAIEYARRREVFGNRIGNYQSIAFRLAEDATYVEAMRLLAYRTLAMADRGIPHTMESSMCKWWIPLTSQQICHRSLLTFGHYGYSDDNPVQQRYRDVVGLEIGDGTAEIQKMVVARRILGREFRPS